MSHYVTGCTYSDWCKMGNPVTAAALYHGPSNKQKPYIIANTSVMLIILYVFEYCKSTQLICSALSKMHFTALMKTSSAEVLQTCLLKIKEFVLGIEKIPECGSSTSLSCGANTIFPGYELRSHLSLYTALSNGLFRKHADNLLRHPLHLGFKQVCQGQQFIQRCIHWGYSCVLEIVCKWSIENH